MLFTVTQASLYMSQIQAFKILDQGLAIFHRKLLSLGRKLLACCWTVEQIECFIMAHQVTL
jgi:hypothetical protein